MALAGASGYCRAAKSRTGSDAYPSPGERRPENIGSRIGHDEVDELAWHDDDLAEGLAPDQGGDPLVVIGRPLEVAAVGVGGHDDPPADPAVDLDGDLDLLVAQKR